MNLPPHLSLFPSLCVDHSFLYSTGSNYATPLRRAVPTALPVHPPSRAEQSPARPPPRPISSFSRDWFSPFPFLPFTSLTEPPSARFLFCLPLFPTSQAASPPAPPHFLSYRFRSGGRLGFIVCGQGQRRSVIRKEHNREGSSSTEVKAGGASPPSTHPCIHPSIRPSLSLIRGTQ